MRKLLKFGHTLGAIGLLGAMAALLLAAGAMASADGARLAGPESIVLLMDRIARWLLLPSLALTIVSGLLGMAAVPAYHSAGWAWAKLATGVLTFEGSLMAIQGPVQAMAETAGAPLDPTQLSALQGSLWTLIGVAVANVALGVWRPRKRRQSVTSAA